MSVRVVLANENPAYAGVLAFDGQVFEVLGFADTTSYRMPVEVIDEVILDDDMFSVLSNPERGDSYGIQQPVKPSDDERVALQELAGAIEGATGGNA
jgi:hypothetical protein